MSNRKRTIEVDETTVAALEKRAAERGVSVSELVAELVDQDLAVEVDPEVIAELDREWAAVESEGTIPHEHAVRWLRTWGTPDFRPWRDE